METAPDLVSTIAAVRALHTGAALLLFGAFVFAGFVDEVEDSSRIGRVEHARNWRLWLLLGCFAVAVSAIAWLGLEAVAMSGGPWRQAWNTSTLTGVLGSTVFGHTWLVRAVLLVALAVLTAQYAPDDRRRTLALVVCSGALLAGLAWQGHANAQSGLDGVVRHLADAAHVVAAGAWVGGLPFFVARLHASLTTSTSVAHTARCVRHYGDVAAVCVGVLVASGAVNAGYTLRKPSLLVESAYGRLLLAKLALFGAMLAIAAVNRWRLTPKLGVSSPVPQTAVRRLRVLAWLELLIGAAVVVLASALATSAPPMRM